MADKHPSVQRPDGVQQSIEAIGTVLIVSGVRGSAVSVSTGPSPSVLIIITAFAKKNILASYLTFSSCLSTFSRVAK